MPTTRELMTRGVVLIGLVLGATPSLASSPALASDTSTRWATFSESSGCGDPFTRGPFVSMTGWLPDSESILGPFGTYFGRSISEVRSRLRDWTVPFSGGQQVQVHEAMLPDLEKVAATLEDHAANGRIYTVDWVGGFVPRTIGGRYRISRHALGLAIDINPAQNPFRDDNVLITDMPDWYVRAWQDAGFCWGGDWLGSKDPMHFAWTGPGPPAGLAPDRSDTSKTTFGEPVASHQTDFGSVMSRYQMTVADVNSNGASDVVGVRQHPEGSVVDIALSSLGFGSCSIGRWFVPDTSIADADRLVFADFDADSGADLIALFPSGGHLDAITATRRTRFQDTTSSTTGAGADAVALTGADFDGDHHADLWEATPDGSLRIWKGPGFTELVDESTLPSGTPSLIAAGDRDGGDTPELFAFYPDGSRIDVLSHNGLWVKETSIKFSGLAVAIAAGDYDGDGRADAQVLTDAGELIVYVGNTSTGVPASRWFMHPDPDCETPILLEYNGRFMDDETSTFTANIEAIASVGVTRGCNPPFNDRFCPRSNVTRGQMAAFLVRALDLVDDTHSGFVDVATDSTFANDIGKLATAGITKGCNPPDNDRYCPDDDVTREQMAAFMVRALDLTAATHPGFVDVPSNSTFANDIVKLATAGITKGCNPPDNDRYCPGQSVTRGQMAAFLDRAGLADE